MGDKVRASQIPDKSRRRLLLLLPIAAIGGVFASVGSAAIRFLRPLTSAVGQKWIDLARLNEISGVKPIARKVLTEQVAGWSTSAVERSVYILPAKNNQVVSAVCPHEGCVVSWQDEENVFSCPCHDSNFAIDGSPISGPAHRELESLPSRVADGKLQIQYQDFVNHTQERTPRI
jgi:Rieske Fe-S protein